MTKFTKIMMIAAAAVVAAPTWAEAAGKRLCCGKKVAMTFGDAAPEVQLLVLIFLGVTVAAAVLWIVAARKRRRGVPAPRTMSFLAAWQVGGPLLAVAGAAYGQVNFWVAVYAYDPLDNYLRGAFGPGLAEASLVLWMGFLAGGVASLAYGDLSERARQA